MNDNLDTQDIIVGIDLGTTNSALSIYQGGGVKVIECDGNVLLPSYVGLNSASNEILIGAPAKNHYLLAPEQTVKSIKRRMGGTEHIVLGDRTFLPEEISALLLSHLKQKGEEYVGKPITRAVITVPAYFNDQQRQATRAAGEIAGFRVERIINEPTAASLAFRNSVMTDERGHELSIVYDLGGGTFDVSIVREENNITEVLSSNGDSHLGGDDFDRLICDFFLEQIRKDAQMDLREDRRVMNRLNHAAEEAKLALSSADSVQVVEEDLVPGAKNPVHLNLELTREAYEDMIYSKIEQTVDCVEQAMRDANITTADIDNILLVGGSTKTPLVRRLLKDFFGKEPRTELHPDLCVTMGAAIQAARLQGVDVEKILVDITPHSFGIATLTYDRYGFPNPNQFTPIIPKNTPLPTTYSKIFCTSFDYQEEVEIRVFQGESEDVRDNTKVGNFRVVGLSKVPEGNQIIGKMSLDLNGILTVTGIEKDTGLQKSITIEGAYQVKNTEDISESRTRLQDYIPVSESETAANPVEGMATERPTSIPGLDKEEAALIERAYQAMEQMHPEDRQEAEQYCEEIKSLAAENKSYDKPFAELQELLYFVGA